MCGGFLKIGEVRNPSFAIALNKLADVYGINILQTTMYSRISN
jgi:hypothetical protein